MIKNLTSEEEERIRNKIIKKLITILIFISILLVFPLSISAEVPKFRVHILKNLAPGVNYSINTPVVIDYDNDNDQDILIITKEGTIYFLENLLNE